MKPQLTYELIDQMRNVGITSVTVNTTGQWALLNLKPDIETQYKLVEPLPDKAIALIHGVTFLREELNTPSDDSIK